MFITKNDLKVLDETSFYLSQLTGEKAVELEFKLNSIIEKLELKRIVKNSINSKLIAERRKTDKNYARSKKGENEDV